MKIKTEKSICFKSTYCFYMVLVIFCVLPSIAWSELRGNLSVDNPSYRVEKERQNWDIFTNRSQINELLLSDDKSTLWVATPGGLEEWDALKGRLKKLYTNQNGLPNNDVSSLVSDGKGGLWVGTIDGNGSLVHIKSDGTWEVLNVDNSNLPGCSVTSLFADGQGGLWVGTLPCLKADGRDIIVYGGGLGHLKADGSWEIFNTDNSDLFDNWIVSLASDSQGGIWIAHYNYYNEKVSGSEDGGLSHLKSDGKWENYNKKNSGLPDKKIYSLLSDDQGGLWVGTWGGGLAHLNADKTCNVLNTENSNLPDNYILSILSDDQEGLWLGTYDGGLAHLKADGSCDILNKDNSKLPSNFVDAMLSDGEGGIWIGTYYIWGGLAHLKSDGSLEIFDSYKSNSPFNKIQSLLSDNKGGIWIGPQNGGGLAHLKSDDSWELFEESNFDLTWISILSITSDGHGGIWMGIDANAEEYDCLAHFKSDGTWEAFNTYNADLPYNKVKHVESDGQGGIWVGTNKGLVHINGDGKWEVFTEKNSDLPENYISALLSDAHGGIWIGTANEGLVHLKSDGAWDTFNKDNSGLPENFIISLISGYHGDIWVGTKGGGLAHLKSDSTWEVFRGFNSDIPSNTVGSVILDNQGGIWAGSNSGLARINGDGKWEVFTEENSDLPDNNISALLSDGHGGVWVGTEKNGLAHLKSNRTWDKFNKDNSDLPSNKIYSVFPDDQGGIWIGTEFGGLVHFKYDGTWEVFDTKNSDLRTALKVIESNDICTINVMLSDGQDGIWIGTEDTGLAHLKSDGTWEAFTKYQSGLSSNSISAIQSDGHGGIWVGTQYQYKGGINSFGGLTHLKEDGTWEASGSGSGPPIEYNFIKSLQYDGQDGLWVGTSFGPDWGGTFSYLKPDGTWKIFDADEKNKDYSDYFPWALLPDGQGGVWVGKYYGGLSHLKSDETWEVFGNDNSLLDDNYIKSLTSDGQGGVWAGIWSGINGGLAHLKADRTWEFFTESNSDIPYNQVEAVLSDGKGGVWIGTLSGGLAHLLQIGTPEQIIKPNSPEITINWFLNSSSLDYQNVKYIELQRSLSQDGVYETVLDASDKLIRFYADYSICPKPRVDNCWVTVEGHTPETRTNSDGSTTKGYTLNTPITDPEWLEGLPRYYRLSAVIEEDGKLVRVANNSEAALITPQVEEKPRVELTLDRNAIAMQPNQKADITVFVSSLDLFRGDVELEIESATGNTISNNINVELEPASVSLKSGETKPVLLTIDAFAESTQTIKIIPKIQSGYSGKSASLNVQVGDGTTPMIALSIAHKTKRTRVLDALTISGNVIPVQAGRSVVISGNNIKESAESATFTTDENGCFQGSVTPIHAGLLTLTAKSNGITSNNAEIFILPSRTNIALSSNVNQSTKKGDILRVQGIITPVRLDGTKVNLDIRYLDPANQDAGLQPQFVGGVEIDENGVFYRDVVVPGNGFINVKASLPETSDYLSVNTKLVIPIGQPVGEGIIVVSESGDADFQTISKSLGNYVYNALKSRNIPAERIKYLGIADDPKFTNGTANKASLHDALTNWATSLFSTDDPYKTPLNLYLIGKVEDGSFRLNDSEILTSDDLAQYLNEAEEIVKTNSKDNYSEYKGFPVTIVLEGTQSGKWIEKIAGNGRIILTSSSDKPVDEGGFAGYDNFGESSFSRYFYEFINYGSDIEGSFAEANYEILKFYRHTQRPVMDADGDGFGTTNFDRYEASGKFIEYRPSGNLRPQIRTTNPDLTINRRIAVNGSESNLDNSTLWAIATDPENEMQGVFCSITDPSDRTVIIEMKEKSDKKNIYEIDLSQTYPNLTTGYYQAVYYAKDKAGNVSLPEKKSINVIFSSIDNAGDVPASPQFKISVSDNSTLVTISWSEVPNADGYKLFYCPYPDCLPADIGEIDMGKQREITFDGKGFAFYGAVKAYNSSGLSDWSNVEFFNLR